MNIKIRLIIMNFLQFAVWGAYLTSMGTYLMILLRVLQLWELI